MGLDMIRNVMLAKSLPSTAIKRSPTFWRSFNDLGATGMFSAQALVNQGGDKLHL